MRRMVRLGMSGLRARGRVTGFVFGAPEERDGEGEGEAAQNTIVVRNGGWGVVINDGWMSISEGLRAAAAAAVTATASGTVEKACWVGVRQNRIGRAHV